MNWWIIGLLILLTLETSLDPQPPRKENEHRHRHASISCAAYNYCEEVFTDQNINRFRHNSVWMTNMAKSFL